MDKYECIACGYIYDPEIGDPDNGIAPGTAFEDLPDDWVCPDCGVGKDEFENRITEFIHHKSLIPGIRLFLLLVLTNLDYNKTTISVQIGGILWQV